MNRENVEKMVAEFPKSMIASWEKMHPEIGGSLEELKSNSMRAERKIRWINGIGQFLMFISLLGTIVLSSYFGLYFKNPTHQTNWVLMLTSGLLGGVVVNVILNRTWAMRHTARQPVDLYESALTKFEASVIKLDCIAYEITGPKDRLYSGAIMLAVERMAAEVLRCSKEFKLCLEQKASVKEIVEAGQDKLSAEKTFAQVVEALAEFDQQIDKDECFRNAKARPIMKT